MGDVSDLIGLPGYRPAEVAARQPAPRHTDHQVDTKASAVKRKQRMRLCLTASKTRAANRPDEVAAGVEQMMQQQAMQQAGRGAGGPELTDEQAENSVIFSMVSLCYHNVDSESLARL